MISQEILQSLDRDIVDGKAERAKIVVEKLAKGRLTREERSHLARLARRSGIPEVSLRLLAPLVRTEGRRVAEAASVMERAEYASALRSAGAIEEAIALLETIQTPDEPETIFLLALSHFSKWDYPKAIPLLKRYLTSPKISDYQRLVGDTNLASALIHEGQLDEGAIALKEMEALARQGNYKYVLSKALYFHAELEVLREAPDAAIRYLEHSDEYLTEPSPLDRLLTRMWTGIARHQKHRTQATRDELGAVRERARTDGAWELVRNCDLHLAWLDRNHELYRLVYFGTPTASFRERMKGLWADGVEKGEHYHWHLCAGESPFSFTARKQQSVLKAGGVPYRLFRALHSDFYRPLRIAELHARVYPGEFFNPISAPLKVKQALKLLRQKLAACGIPLQVVDQGAGYALSSKNPFSLEVTSNAPTSRNDEILRRLHEYFSTPFSAKEAAKQLAIPHRTMQRALESAVKQGDLGRGGKTGGTRYAFATTKQK